MLADGTVFEGEAVGYVPEGGVATGEVVFNTAMSGYQEILTDPSYAGQVITFTYPHIGNYGINTEDFESRRPFCRGVVVRDLARRPSNWRASGTLDDFLRQHRVPGIAGIDTRRLTRHLRDAGALPGAFGTDEAAVRAAASGAPSTDGLDLVAEVTDRPALHGGRPGHGALPGGRLRLRDQGHDPAPSRDGRGARSRSCPPPSRLRPCSPVSPTASSCRTVPVTRPPSPAPPPPWVRSSVGCPSSGSASVTRSSGSRSVPRPASCCSATTAPTTPCATRRPAGSRSRARTTTTRSCSTA